jgi:hypothetical protein
LSDSIDGLTNCAPGLSHRFSRLPCNVCSGLRTTAAIERAKRKQPERNVHKPSLQIVSGTKRRFQCIAKLVFSGFGHVVK